MQLDIEVIGLDDALKRLDLALPRVLGLLRAGLYQEGEAIMAEAKRRVPIDTGALASSGHVQPPSGDELVVRLGFGGPSAPYSVFVHEDLSAHHEVGQAKFLESAALEAQRGMADRLVERVKRGRPTSAPRRRSSSTRRSRSRPRACSNM